ncbi:hypothetical protein MJO29_002286 [Puccinia striiformis f. sp. tritici]|nr:hypothetical protein MJO29_002286 [Puccinia striiformis f. sp. tritici]
MKIVSRSLELDLLWCPSYQAKQGQYQQAFGVHFPISYAGVKSILDKVPGEKIVSRDFIFHDHQRASNWLSSRYQTKITSDIESRIKTIVAKFTVNFLH